jgi:hypothetical protein
MDDNIKRIFDLGDLIQAERATSAEAIEWLELVSNGNSVRDKAVAIIKEHLLAPAPIEGLEKDAKYLLFLAGWFERLEKTGQWTEEPGVIPAHLRDMANRLAAMSQEPVKPSDILCSFCGVEHEYRNLYHNHQGSICRECVADAQEWMNSPMGKPKPSKAELIEKYTKIICKGILAGMQKGSFAKDCSQILTDFATEMEGKG